MEITETQHSIVAEPEQAAEYAVIWLHGLGANGYDFLPMLEYLPWHKDRPIRFIFLNAPSRMITINAEMVMPAWYDIQSLQNLDLEDKPGICESEQLVLQALEQQMNQGIAAEHIILGGFSQGGAMALYTALRFSYPLAGAVCLSGYLPQREELSAEELNRETPLFLAHGFQDDIVPTELFELSCKALVEWGFKLSQHTYPMGHEVSGQEWLDLSQWLKSSLMI